MTFIAGGRKDGLNVLPKVDHPGGWGGQWFGGTVLRFIEGYGCYCKSQQKHSGDQESGCPVWNNPTASIGQTAGPFLHQQLPLW